MGNHIEEAWASKTKVTFSKNVRETLENDLCLPEPGVILDYDSGDSLVVYGSTNELLMFAADIMKAVRDAFVDELEKLSQHEAELRLRRQGLSFDEPRKPSQVFSDLTADIKRAPIFGSRDEDGM